MILDLLNQFHILSFSFKSLLGDVREYIKMIQHHCRNWCSQPENNSCYYSHDFPAVFIMVAALLDDIFRTRIIKTM